MGLGGLAGTLTAISITLQAATLIVTTNNDTGPGSLRQAIMSANAASDTDTITFNIPGPGPLTIALQSALPAITNAVTIDGTTQPGFSSAPLVELNGASAGAGVNGLTLSGPSNTIRGLVINRFSGSGIKITSPGNVIAGNFIGTDLLGMAGRPNGGNGVLIQGGSNSRIGGTNEADRNVVSGNTGMGILLTNTTATGNLVQGNYVGLTASGTGALGNGSAGIVVRGGAKGNTVGGAVPGAGNVVSANGVAATWGMDGIDLFDNGTSGNLIQGNLIGTDASGIMAMGNLDAGISLMYGASSNIVGGTIPGAGNVIADAGAGGVKPGTHDGIYLEGVTTTFNVIQGNFIGTDSTGTRVLANLNSGIRLWDGPHDNLIGGIAVGAGNRIAYHAGAGVYLDVTAGGKVQTNNAILGNLIFANRGLGIDIGSTGMTPNDDGDPDTGANNLQNNPVLTAAYNTPEPGLDNTEIQGNLNSRPNTTYRVEFFANTRPDTGGRIWLGAQSVTTGANGNTNFVVRFSTGNLAIQNVTAAATDPANNTSEFSVPQTIAPFRAPVLTVQPRSQTVGVGMDVVFEVVANGPAPLLYQWHLNGAPIATATNSSLLLTNVPLSVAGEYSVAVSNMLGGTVSLPVTLTVLTGSVRMVLNTNDSGVGSLRQAIISANASNDLDTIVFNIPGAGPHTIRAANALPNVTTPIIIDGYSQPGAHPNTLIYGDNAVIKIRLVGSGTGDGAKGISINDAGCQVRGLAILGFNSDGIYLFGLANTVVEGNFIGVDVDGVSPVPNGGFGIRTTAAGAHIGGPTPPQRNVISANSAGGFYAQNSGNHVIQGNIFGADASVTLPRGNQGPAIQMMNPNASSSLIGGSEVSAGNILAASSGTTGFGLLFNGCFNNRVEGNWIGTDYTGSVRLGNALGGIYLTNASDCFVGGTNTNTGNVIAYNGGPGVWVLSATNTVLGNILYDNTGLAIDLGNSGAQPNDAGDGDSGPNGLQNFPVLASPAYLDAGNLWVYGVLNSRTSTTYRVELFSSPVCAPAGFGEGKHLIGVTNVTTDSAGNAAFSHYVPTFAWSDTAVTATATAPDGSTSEFSPCARILPRVEGPAFLTLQPVSQSAGIGATVSLIAEANGSTPLRFQWRRNGIDLLGLTNATLTLANLQATDAGAYTVTVFNDLGSDISAVATVRVVLPALAMTDNFSTTVGSSAQTGLGQSSNTLATFQAGEPLHAEKLGGKSMWFSWKAPKTGIAMISTAGSDFDSLLAVYQGTVVSALLPVAADDDSGGFYGSTVRFNADANMVYRIAVDGLGAASGTIVLQWSLESTADLLPDIAIQPMSQTVDEGNSVLFSVGAVGTELAYQWYFNGEAITGAISSTLTVNGIAPAQVGSYVAQVRRGTRTAYSHPAHLQLNHTGNQTQDVRTHDKFRHMIQENNPLRLAGPPASGAEGKSRAVAASASVSRGYSGSQVFDTSAGHKEPGEPNHCGVPGGASQWFAYLADAAGELFLNTDGSTFDTVLAVYSGSGIDLASLTPVACDNNSGSNGLTSRLQFPVSPGALYYIAIDGVGGATGIARLNYGLAFLGRLRALGKNPAGANRLSLSSQAGGSFTLEASADLVSWFVLVTTNSSTSTWEYTDTSSINVPRRFYRVSGVP